MTSAATRPVEGRPGPSPAGHDAPEQPLLPGQRTPHRLIVPAPAASGWEGYSNAGPDVYWPPDRDGALAS